MLTTITFKKKRYTIDLSRPLDISMELRGNAPNVNAWYVGPPTITPHEEKGFVGAVKEGASINFNTIAFNPHAHGTHTECVGHIAPTVFSVNEVFDRYFFKSELITIAPEKIGEDFVISKKQLQYALGNKKPEALVIRTLPNIIEKCMRQYSHTNPPYLEREAAQLLVDKGVQHLLIDLPSVDREKDDGELIAHKTFWGFPNAIRHKATITEFIYVPNSVKDGSYMVNMQVAPFQNDASPSRPVLYKIEV